MKTILAIMVSLVVQNTYAKDNQFECYNYDSGLKTFGARAPLEPYTKIIVEVDESFQDIKVYHNDAEIFNSNLPYTLSYGKNKEYKRIEFKSYPDKNLIQVFMFEDNLVGFNLNMPDHNIKDEFYCPKKI